MQTKHLKYYATFLSASAPHHTNEWGRSLEECEGHHEVHISTTGAKFLMPDGMRWDVKPLLITMLLALIASVLFSNCFVAMDLWLLITSSWNTPQIILPSLCSLTSKSSCHLAPARAAPIKKIVANSLPTRVFFRKIIPWISGCYRHFSEHTSSEFLLSSHILLSQLPLH